MPDAEGLAILPVSGLGEVAPGTDLARLIAEAPTGGAALRSGDVVVVTQKIVSKAEGRLVPLDHDDPEAKARPGGPASRCASCAAGVSW